MIEVIKPEVEVYNLSRWFDKLNEKFVSDITNDPSIELPTHTVYPNERMAEYIGRICYNSYDKMTPTSFIKFNKGAANKSHRSVFEFGNILITIFITSKIDFDSLNLFLLESNFIKHEILTGGEFRDNSVNIFNIYGSPRAFIEAIELFVGGNTRSYYPVWLPIILNKAMITLSSSFYDEWATASEIHTYIKHISFQVSPPAAQYSDITLNTALKNDKFKKILFKLVTDKGCHNELVRHRPVAIMAESQRYVRYGIGENEKNPFKICIASCHLTDEKYVKMVTDSSENSFNVYKELLRNEYPPQQARAALPIATAMTYFMYCDLQELSHICSLRTAKTALPLAQEVIKEVRDQAVNKLLI